MIAAGSFLVKGQIEQRVTAEVAASAERTRADLAEDQVERMEDALAEERELQTELQEARDVEAAATEVLEDRGRLERLTQAKPGLIERQARRATTRVWEEIEAESRE